MTGVHGPREATTADVLAAQAHLDEVLAAGGPWGPALEDAELTSEASYRAVLRESAQAPAELKDPAGARNEICPDPDAIRYEDLPGPEAGA